MAEGSRRQLAYVVEVTPGTTPGTPAMKLLRNTGGGGIKVARTQVVSAEMRSDRAIPDVKLGNKAPTIDIPFEFSYGSYDDFLESALQGAWATNVLKQAATKKWFTIEEGFTDIPQYQPLSGCLVNSMSLNIAPNAIVTGSFGILGLTAGAFSGTPLDASPDALPTTTPFDSFTGSILEGGSSIAIVTALSLNVNNGLEQLFALFAANPSRIGSGRANITGSISAYFDSVALANKFLNETESSLSFTLTDLAGNDYIFLIPRIKYTAADKSIAENSIVIDLPFQALYDTGEATALKITRVPA